MVTPAKPAAEPRRGVEGANIGEVVIGDEAVAIGRPVEHRVMQDDGLAVAGQHQVDLAGRRAGEPRLFEGEQRVLRVMQAIAAMGADMGEAVVRGAE